MTRKRRSQRLRRVDEVLRQTISDNLLTLTDPRLRGVVVTGVEASPDTAAATVYVQISANEHRQERSLAALERARPVLQARINEEMHLRHTPILRFTLDDSADEGRRIEALLADLEPLPPPVEPEEGV